MKKVSIITINYNNREGLKKTIESITNQTFSNYEYIIIDGGSTDGSVDIIKKHADKIDYWVSEPDQGIYHAMNKGILKAHGEYCNFMNSGDTLYSSSTLEEIFTQTFTESILIGKYASVKNPKGSGYQASDITMLGLCKRHPNHQATFIKKELFNDNQYDENFKIVSDWKFFIEMIIYKNCSVALIDTLVTFYDLEGISSLNKKLYEQECTQVLRGIFPERIYQDYKYFIKSDSTILRLTPYFNKTRGFQKLIYGIINTLIHTRLLLYKLLGKKLDRP